VGIIPSDPDFDVAKGTGKKGVTLEGTNVTMLKDNGIGWYRVAVPFPSKNARGVRDAVDSKWQTKFYVLFHVG